MTSRDPWLIPLALALVLLAVLLAGCQTQGELPACTMNCTVIVIGTQDRGGQQGQASVPVL